MRKELLDVVDEHNHIVTCTSYEEVHAKKLAHRVVVAMLLNDADEVLIQLRAKTKSAYPSHWSFSFGGHVRHGETYLKALIREGKEEIGVIFSPKDFTKRGSGTFSEHSQAEVIYEMYTVTYDGPIEEHTEEVDAVQFVSWVDLRKMIDGGKEKFHPQLVIALKRHFAKELGL